MKKIEDDVTDKISVNPTIDSRSKKSRVGLKFFICLFAIQFCLFLILCSNKYNEVRESEKSNTPEILNSVLEIDNVTSAAGSVDIAEEEVATEGATKKEKKDIKQGKVSKTKKAVEFSEVVTEKEAQKELEKGNLVYTSDKNVIELFNKKYLSFTNYSCLAEVKKGKYYFYDKATISSMEKENERLRKIDIEPFIDKQVKAICKLCNKSTQSAQLKALEKYMIDHFEYDTDYKTGERTKWSRYQDMNSANTYYLLKTNKGICADFVDLYKRCCDQLNIDCIIEYGGTKSSKTRDHAWNIVVADSIQRYKDITWDIQKHKRVWCDETKVTVKYFIKNHHMMCSY